MKQALVPLFLIVSFSAMALDGRPGIADFYANPKKFSKQLPHKTSLDGTPIKNESLFFEDHQIHDRDYVDFKDQVRLDLMSGDIKAGMQGNDRVSSLLGRQDIINSPEEMDRQNLQEGKVATNPWSDDYWPIYSGILGKRYADPNFAYKDDWRQYFDYVQDYSAATIYAKGDAKEIDQLSPSEKYDILIGDKNFTLTKRMWAEGKQYYDRYGEVETWMGVCHGWAPASYMLERPAKKITVMAADGKTELNFYPSDIKALSTLLWANTRTPTNFIGGRCNDKEPEEDENGRVLSQECFDNNPGTWHMAIVNSVGVDKASFVFDATYDYQVWNQPVMSYQYVYFNPQNMKEGVPFDEALVPIEEFEKDVYKKYRDRNTRYVVGVEMRVTYSVESSPSQTPVDSEEYDSYNVVYYMYDLELDSDKKIIGGEWYQSLHPDFSWTPVKGTRALSVGDYSIVSDEDWQGRKPLPESWRSQAVFASSYKQPLARVVESLIKLSR